MTVEMIFDKLINRTLSPKEANEMLQEKEHKKGINGFIYRGRYPNTEPLNESELSKLSSIVNILQIIYNSGEESCISDEDYDVLQETLINEGVPRLTGSINLSDKPKLSHIFTQLRGTLDKVYYLFSDEPRVNPSRRYLDEWKSSMERLYERKTGKQINLDNEQVIVTPKFDGCSVEMNVVDRKILWMSRGDTKLNQAVDYTAIMSQFNDVFMEETDKSYGKKFEVMVSEEEKDEMNRISSEIQYKSSRSLASSIMNSDEPDFRVKFLHPICLRKIFDGDDIEQISDELLHDYPMLICKLSDRDQIKHFAFENKFVTHGNHTFRTDGVVIAFTNTTLQRILGRDNDINNFEVAFKHTGEYAYSKVKHIEFYTSEFGYVTPVVVVEDVKLKGNTINHISLSTKERFDELHLAKGDIVKVLYDIIPYLTLDSECKRSGKAPIPFITKCPSCNQPLKLDVVQVKCENDQCECRLIGRISNYCATLRIKNIGLKSLQRLYSEGLLNHGIRSLYRLKNKTIDIEMIEGFGKVKTKKFIKEIESKRRLKDYEFFGAYGIEGLSTTSFELIFNKIPFHTFIELVNDKKQHDTLRRIIKDIAGFGDKKVDLIMDYLSKKDNRKELNKTLEEVTIIESYSEDRKIKGTITFSGFRDDTLKQKYESEGYRVTDNLSNNAVYLIIPYEGFKSSKVDKALKLGIPIRIRDDD